jgi:hypothetical protein
MQLACATYHHGMVPASKLFRPLLNTDHSRSAVSEQLL